MRDAPELLSSTAFSRAESTLHLPLAALLLGAVVACSCAWIGLAQVGLKHVGRHFGFGRTCRMRVPQLMQRSVTCVFPFLM